MRISKQRKIHTMLFVTANKSSNFFHRKKHIQNSDTLFKRNEIHQQYYISVLSLSRWNIHSKQQTF